MWNITELKHNFKCNFVNKATQDEVRNNLAKKTKLINMEQNTPSMWF